MSFKTILFAGFIASAAFVAVPAMATDDPEKEEKKGPVAGEPVRFESEGEVTIEGEAVAYTAIAGETFLRDETDEPIAAMFSISYLKKDVEDPAERPVMFVFNGGPGSASLWLHLGTFGPKRVVVPSDAKDDGAPPYPLVDN
ncbi:MAG: peptidase S10, partial [Pseudomonadota bacterium]